jgi:hypothetical protein
MKKTTIIIIYLIIFLFVFFTSCTRRSVPTIIYQDKTVVSYDTIKVESRVTDTIPCADFTDTLYGKDTVYVQVVSNKLTIKTRYRTDTVYRTPTIIEPQARRVKIDNSINAKKGSIIGDGNTMTTKKQNWWWVFLSGVLTMFILQNVIIKGIKTYLKF